MENMKTCRWLFKKEFSFVAMIDCIEEPSIKAGAAGGDGRGNRVEESPAYLGAKMVASDRRLKALEERIQQLEGAKPRFLSIPKAARHLGFPLKEIKRMIFDKEITPQVLSDGKTMLDVNYVTKVIESKYPKDSNYNKVMYPKPKKTVDFSLGFSWES